MFPYTLSNHGATVFIDGKPKLFSSGHASYPNLKAAILAGDENEVRVLMDVKRDVLRRTLGRVEILDNTILVDGTEVNGVLVDRILEMSAMGNTAIDGYIRFLDRLMNNPSKTAIDELYLFIEACNLPITPDGFFLAYKLVGLDYMSLYSANNAKKFDNSVGETPTMERNEVDDNRDNTCSDGLHFCSYSYLPHYGNGKRVMVLKVAPASVVSIPSDYNNAKGRTWTYEVVGEIEDWKGEPLTPYFTDEFTEEVDAGVNAISHYVGAITHTISDDGTVSMVIPDNISEEDVMEYIDKMDIERNSISYSINDFGNIIMDDVTNDDEVVDNHGITHTTDSSGWNEINIPDEASEEDVIEYIYRMDIENAVKEIYCTQYIKEVDDVTDDDTVETMSEDDVMNYRDLMNITPEDVTVASEAPLSTVKKQKLSPAQVHIIKTVFRQQYNDGIITLKAIGNKFNVHRETISRIFKGKLWKHIT